jgi:hypothetical protein
MTPEQNKYYRAHILRRIATELHRDEDEAHQYLKGKFIHMKYLSDEDMTKYITDVSVWAAEHGIILEEPHA